MFEGGVPGAVSSSRAIHWKVIRQYLEDASLDQNAVRAWIAEKQAALARAEHSRSAVRTETSPVEPHLIFRRVRGGTVVNPSTGMSHKVEPFEMMTTLVTQSTWSDRMKNNPSHFREDSYVENYSGEKYRVEGAVPVDSVSFWSAAEFANRLSIERGFGPYYDFRGAVWEPGTSADRGSLAPESSWEAARIWRAHLASTSRDRRGYRLPFFSEWQLLIETVLEAEKVHKEPGKVEFYWRSRNPGALSLHEIGWFSENSGGHPHAVNEGAAIEADGHEFFGLVGNLCQWVNEPEHLAIGTVGQHYMMSAESMMYDEPSPALVGGTGYIFGFRLARSLLE